MKAVEPKLRNIMLGKDQEEYITLPAYMRSYVPSTPVITKWEFSDEEVQEIVKNKTIYYSQFTGGNRFHPVLLSVHEADVYTDEELDYCELRERNKKGNQAILEFSTECMKCSCRTPHRIIDIDTSEDGVNTATGECMECGTLLKDFVADLLAGSTPEERTRIVTDEWNKDNTYRPFCGNCLGTEKMQHIEGGWECPNCKAIGMRATEETTE